MAARRLLIIMLILLGISTLAAALIPEHALRRAGTGSATTTTQPQPTTTTGQPRSAVPPSAAIVVGGKKLPVIPVHVGQRFTILALSYRPTELSIPAFGLVSYASPAAPARFELLTETPGRIGILFNPPLKLGKCVEQVAAVIQVLRHGEKPKPIPSAKCGARAGSGRP